MCIYIQCIHKHIYDVQCIYKHDITHTHTHSHTAPAHLVPGHIPYDKIQIGPAFPLMGGLFLEFPTFELAMRISLALEQSPSHPKIIMLPSIYVSTLTLLLLMDN